MNRLDMHNEAACNSSHADVSVVIVNYNAGDLLVISVTAALAQARQVVVVDNASTDSSLELLESCCADESRLKIVRREHNVGFAAGCNIGIGYCREPYILFLNPDCVLSPNTLDRMLHTLNGSTDRGMVGGLLLNPDGHEQGGGRRAVPTPWRSFVRAFGLTRLAPRWPRLFSDFHLHEQPLPQQPVEVEAISGALMLVRKEVLEKLGAWDEDYFLHCEDLDLCMRFRRSGWNIVFDPGAPAVHIHGTCSHSRPIFVEWHKHKGMVRFYRKFFRNQYPGILMWLVVLGVWIRFATVAILKSLKRREYPASYSKSDFEQQRTDLARDNNVHPSAGRQKDLGVVAVVGATSMVGRALLPMLSQQGIKVVAYSRNSVVRRAHGQDNIEWREISTLAAELKSAAIPDWVWLAPIKALPAQLQNLQRIGAQHIVAVSTTSRFTKKASSSATERQFVKDLVAAESDLQSWARAHGASWTILRPTLIYGFGLDKNISVIARFIRRFHFFPVLGKALGMRQPIHARDVAAACKSALESEAAANRAYNISGAEKLSYRDMVVRIFNALAIRPRFLAIPLWMFSTGVALVRLLPGYRSWSSAMAERMNLDMVFDYDEATRDFGFTPQAFVLNTEDLPDGESTDLAETAKLT